MPRTLIMSPARVRRTVTRLAYEVIERNRGGTNLMVFGIPKRGLAMAVMIAEALGKIDGHSVIVHKIDITPFRDDISANGGAPDADRFDVADRDVLLVDDVLFTGRTARAALDAILHHGRPRSIQLAVLIDRGHREYPIQLDYVGRVIPTKYGERIEVETDGEPAVYLAE